MKSPLRWCIVPLMLLLLVPATVPAAVTPEQRREFNEIRSDATKAASLIRRKQTDEASKLLDDVAARLKKLMEDAKLPETDRQAQALLRLIETQRELLAKQTGEGAAKGKGEGVSFVSDVAPILSASCLKCHGDDPKGGLRLDTFAGMEAGGTNKPLLVVGNPNGSLLIRRLTTPNPRDRMPRGGQPLTPQQIQTIALWIAQGAKFDGQGKDVPLAELKKDSKETPPPPVQIAKATGNETISFSKDIAPTFVNVCGGCHGGDNPRGGLSMATFERLMKGGESGAVIVPGKPDESRLWRLVNADEAPVMPQGQARITRKWHANLRTWITEGAKYDGGDPKKPLRELVPTAEQLRQAELAKLSPDEFVKLRRKTTDEQWHRTLPRVTPESVETPEFLIYGDVSTARLKEIGDWAEEQAKALRTMFNAKEEPLWKGKLAILVFKERFGFEEFHRTIASREVPREVVGYAEVSPTFEEAYVVLQDLPDSPSDGSPGMRMNLNEHLAGAFLKRGRDVPDWVIRGTGIALSAKGEGSQRYLTHLHARAAELMKSVDRPEDLFADGTFSPADVGPIGYTLVEFLLKQRGGGAAFGQFVKRLQTGESVDAALRAVYQADSKALAAAYARAMSQRR